MIGGMSQPQTILYLAGLSMGLLGLLVSAGALVYEKRTATPEERERAYRQRVARFRQYMLLSGAIFAICAFFMVLASLGGFLGGDVVGGIAIVALALGLFLAIVIIAGLAWWLIRWVAR